MELVLANPPLYRYLSVLLVGFASTGSPKIGIRGRL